MLTRSSGGIYFALEYCQVALEFRCTFFGNEAISFLTALWSNYRGRRRLQYLRHLSLKRYFTNGCT